MTQNQKSKRIFIIDGIFFSKDHFDGAALAYKRLNPDCKVTNGNMVKAFNCSSWGFFKFLPVEKQEIVEKAFIAQKASKKAKSC